MTDDIAAEGAENGKVVRVGAGGGGFTEVRGKESSEFGSVETMQCREGEVEGNWTERLLQFSSRLKKTFGSETKRLQDHTKKAICLFK